MIRIAAISDALRAGLLPWSSFPCSFRIPCFFLRCKEFPVLKLFQDLRRSPYEPADNPEGRRSKKNQSRSDAWKKNSPTHGKNNSRLKCSFSVWNFHSRLKTSILSLVFLWPERGSEWKSPFSIENSIPYWKLDFNIASRDWIFSILGPADNLKKCWSLDQESCQKECFGKCRPHTGCRHFPKHSFWNFFLVGASALLAGVLIGHFLRGRSLKGTCNIRVYVPLCVCVCVCVCVFLCVCVCLCPSPPRPRPYCGAEQQNLPHTRTWPLTPVPASVPASNCATYAWEELALKRCLV